MLFLVFPFTDVHEVSWLLCLLSFGYEMENQKIDQASISWYISPNLWLQCHSLDTVRKGLKKVMIIRSWDFSSSPSPPSFVWYWFLSIRECYQDLHYRACKVSLSMHLCRACYCDIKWKIQRKSISKFWVLIYLEKCELCCPKFIPWTLFAQSTS